VEFIFVMKAQVKELTVGERKYCSWQAGLVY
jgi:hypothetical protein